jgi:phosphatidylserine decarboxylase
MREYLFILIQTLLPQHFVTRAFGWLANCRQVYFKNYAIRRFMKKHRVELSEAVQKQPEDYLSFNDFFIRHIDMQLRPIANGINDIACPVDGCIAQLGKINQDKLLQAKKHSFSLPALLGDDRVLAQEFHDGEFITLYLAPHNYHRVHMPITGKLQKTIYVPGKLFSVNKITTDHVQDLYSRNERLICLFDTKAGPLAVILVGAMIVGSMQTVWMQHPIRASEPKIETFDAGMVIEKGQELGYFKLGSTVILLFAKGNAEWQENMQNDLPVQVGQQLGKFFSRN